MDCTSIESGSVRSRRAAAAVEGDAAVRARRQRTVSSIDLRILKTEPPIFTALVHGQAVELTEAQLASFSLFKRRCMSALRIVPCLPQRRDSRGRPRRPADVWDAIVDRALATAVEEEPAEEVSPRGLVWEAICHILTTDRLQTRDRQLAQTTAVWVEPEFYAVRGEALRFHLQARECNLLSRAHLWELVRSKGGASGTLRTRADEVTRVWRVPREAVREHLEPGTRGERSA